MWLQSVVVRTLCRSKGHGTDIKSALSLVCISFVSSSIANKLEHIEDYCGGDDELLWHLEVYNVL